ncbi:MAG: 3-oxoacyl-ACP reductase FabG [Actinomycetes bacterium]
MSGSLEGRRALVTGGTRGIGRGIVIGLAERGASVYFTGRDAQAGAAVAAEVPGATFIVGDLRDSAQVERIVADAIAQGGGLDILCHNAGIYPENPLDTMPDEAWHDVLNTNLTSAMVLSRAALPALRASGRGRIVLISSITGPRTAIESLTHYAASKSGLEGFGRAAAVELARDGITVNCVAPGTIMTEGLAALYSEPGSLAEVEGRIPAGRIGSPADIAGAVAFLASDDAAYITGQSITVDGGQTLPEVQG